MALNIYSPRTLNGNWFEDRLQPQEALSATSRFHERSPRDFETDLARLGEKYDVLPRVSRMPPRVSYAAPDDGFSIRFRTSAVDFADPKSRTEFVKGKVTSPCMINTANAPVCPPELRPLPGPLSGFGAAINRHGEGHGQHSFNTTNGDFYGPPTHRHPPRPDPCEEPRAGLGTEQEEQKVQSKRLGRLCAEKYTASTDPAVDTRTQRSWLYNEDPPLRHVERGGAAPPLSARDNALSLPLGDGHISKVRADYRERQGRLFRTGTEITKAKEQLAGVKIFLDDHGHS